MIVPIIKEPEWVKFLEQVELWHPSCFSMLVLAPHPDDETLGVGGLIAMQRRHGIAITIAAITDGEMLMGMTSHWVLSAVKSRPMPCNNLESTDRRFHAFTYRRVASPCARMH